MKLDWRRGVLYATTMGMEGCWLYALIALINRQAVEERLWVIGLLLLYPVSFGFNWLLQRRRWHRILLSTISWVVWVGAMLLIVKIQIFSDLAWADSTWLWAVPRAIADIFYGFKPELLILLSTGAIWWLGRRLAGLALSFVMSVSEFQFGLVILLITFFSASQLGASLANAVPTALVFFFCGLLGMSIAHAVEGTGWLSGLYRRQWATLLLASIGLIVLLGFLIVSLVTPDFLQLILTALKWLWELTVKAITFIVSLLPKPESSQLPPPAPAPSIGPSLEEFNPWNLSEEARQRLQMVWNIVMGGILLLALWRVSSQIISWLRRRLAGSGAEIEPIPGAFRADLLSLLKRLLLKLVGFVSLLRFFRKSRAVISEVASVRQIYRQLLRWAAVRGYPRSMHQTPHEYLYTLAGVLPQAQEDLDFITQQYVRVRYSPSLPAEGELDQLKQSWSNVRQIRLKRPSR